MEGWKYLGHKDVCKDFMMENRPSRISRDGSRNRNPAERCPRPLYSWDSTKKHHIRPQQSGNFRDNNIVVKEEFKEENEEYGLYKDIMMEQPSNRNPPERCPHPLYSRDSTQEDLTIPHHDQGEDLINMKTEDEEEETYVRNDQQCTEEAGMMRTFIEEDTPTEISTGCKMEDQDVTQDCSGQNTITSAMGGQLHSVDTQTYHIDTEPPRTVRDDTGIQGWKTFSCPKCGENEQEAPHQQAEMSARGSSQRRGGRSCPISSDGRGLQVQATVSPRSAPLSSAVWAFFNTCAADRTAVICSLCQQRLRRGNTIGHLGTTCMKRHMSSYHAALWEQHLNASRHQPNTTPSLSSSSLSTTPTTVQDSLSVASNDGGERLSKGVRGLPCGTSSGENNLDGATQSRGKRRLQPCSDSANPPPPSPDLALNRQVSLSQLTECKEESASSPPHAQCLNASLTKLLALQLLPFQLVESKPFREFAACAAPHWQVPSQHFFSHKAIPALYHHVEGNVSTSLHHAISSRVHMTADTWSSKHGQGHYISFTAHWVTLLAAGKDAGRGTPLEQVLPPRVLTSGDCDRSLISTSSMPYSTESSSESPVPHKRSRGYSTAKAKRCHAVLQLVCLRDKSHVGAEILTALQGQTQRWLTPCHLVPGMVMCDNSTNLLSALRQGKFTHVPCLAHLLNLVVQRFLVRYPGLQNLLRQARRVCSHFRRSYPASVRLGEIQRELHLPTTRLISDMPTQWNSTLAMLQQLHMHQWAINKYLCEYGTRTGSRELGFVSPHQWLLIQDACTILSPFEEATRMVSRDYACISDTIPVVFLLEHTLRGIIDRALQTQQKEDDYFLVSKDPFYPDFVPVRPQQVQEEEEFGCHGSIEEEEDLGQASRNEIHPSQSQGVVRGWGEIAEDNVVLIDSEDSGSSASSNLYHLGSFMLQCLQKEPSICGIKARDHYWLATLLDPRYKEKVAELILPSQREQKMKRLEDVLRKNMLTSFPGAGTIPFHGQHGLEPPVGERRNSVGGGCLSEAFKTFFSTQRPGLSAGRSYRQRLNQMVADYIGSRVDVDTLSTDDPLDYWVTRMDHWPELAQYAIELLGCPAASILSEQTFNVAGGFVAERRVDLSPDTTDQLTFVKMNQPWITNNYQAPAADTTN